MANNEKQPALGQGKLAGVSQSQAFAYGFAVVVSVLTLLARLGFSPWLDDHPLLLVFFLPILFSAYIGGLGPSLVATAIAVIGSKYYLIPVVHSFSFEKSATFTSWLFLVVGGVVASILNEALHRAWRRADASQKLNAVTLASIGDAVITTDAQGRVTFLNGEAERLTGWTNADAAGQSLPTVFHIVNEETRATVEDPVEKVFLTNGVVGLANHTVLIARDGREFIIDDSGAPIRGADGKIIGVVLVFRDNTEKKRAEDAIHESQMLYFSLVDQIPAGVFRKDAAGRFIFVNSAFCELKGMTQEQFLGKTVLELGLADTALAVSGAKHHEQIMKTGQRIEVQEQYIHPDGRTLFFEVIKSPTFDAHGEITGSQTILFDVTKRLKIEAAHARLAAIVESSDDAIISKTLKGVITSWNGGAERLFGYTATEAIGRPLLMLFPPEREHEERDILEKMRSGQIIERFETVRVRKDGKQIDISVTLSPIRDGSGKVIGVSKIARDITGFKRLEEQLRQSQKMEAIGQLAGGVAHDFNNILAIIQLQIGLLESCSELLPLQKDFIKEIFKSTERAANLTRQLLLFSRKQTLQPQDLDLNEIITNITNMLQRTLGEDVHLQLNFSLEPLFIRADPGMMEQILVNLAVNSRDAMPKGGRLIIETSAVEFDEAVAQQSPQARPGVFTCLSVSDTGCGIAPDILLRIFEPFFTTKDVGKGTGLGLATVFGIVQQHQGWISVYSEVEIGTTFRIYLPRLAESTHRPAAASTLTEVRGGNETILLVEDEPALCVLVHTVLTQLGYRVIEASNGADALAAWEKYRDEIHLLLTDMVLPNGMNGKEIARRLVRKNPKLKVIYTSGYSAEVVGNDLILQEGVNFLTKPFLIHKLAQTVRKYLDKN